MSEIKIIECPRDAMQSWPHVIPTADKIRYINQLIKTGFDTIDFVSFVSHSIVPQMADSAEVAKQVDAPPPDTRLLAIVLNIRGAEDALRHGNIHYLGFPLSVSETFQQRNANRSISESRHDLQHILELCAETGKEVVVYLSMAFGNPYGDAYSDDIVAGTAEAVARMGVNIISLADTVGLAAPKHVERLTKNVIDLLPDREIGVHLHSTPENWRDKLLAAHESGCLRFDGAINGYGGCPMAGDHLVGNMNTGMMVRFFKEQGYLKHISDEELLRSEQMAAEIFW